MLEKITIMLFVGIWTVTDANNVLAGKSGVGKSYIATLSGCPSAIFSGERSCIQQTEVCSNGIIDAVGLDHDDIHTVSYQGQERTLSGLTYPIYNLLDTLEASHITDITLFEVVDANNVRRGLIADEFFNFMQNELGCQSTPIMNKYRDEHHSKLKGNEIIVREGQTTAPALVGVSCTRKLPTNWRDVLLNQDVYALKGAYKKEQCNALTTRKSDTQRALDEQKNKPDEGNDNNNCQYWGETGGRWCRGIKVFGKCSDWEPNRGWKTDHDCVRRRDLANEERRSRNQAKRNLIVQHESTLQGLHNTITAMGC